MKLANFLFIALFASHCGVEAGNVGKGRTGQLKVLFAQESSSGEESLSVSVDSLGLIDSSDSEAATLSPSVNSVDLYSSSASDGVLVAESSLIPSGKYAKIAIRLGGDKPISFRDENGLSHDVGFESSSSQSFYFVQDIEVKEGQTTTLVVNIDPYNSLANSDDKGYVFNPRGELSRLGEEHGYSGTTSVSNAKWACIYAYGLLGIPSTIGPSFPTDPWSTDDGDDMNPFLQDSEESSQIQSRPSFGSKIDLMKDETSDCFFAFAKTSVKSGKFEFRYLMMGTYAVRIFTSDGSYSDESEDIVISK